MEMVETLQWIVALSVAAGYSWANAMYFLDTITRKAQHRQTGKGLCDWCKTLIKEGDKIK